MRTGERYLHEEKVLVSRVSAATRDGVGFGGDGRKESLAREEVSAVTRDGVGFGGDGWKESALQEP